MAKFHLKTREYKEYKEKKKKSIPLKENNSNRICGFSNCVATVFKKDINFYLATGTYCVMLLL